MANYYETTRTNYFKVTDEDRYKELFGNLCSEDEIHDFTKIDKDGAVWHGFGSYGTIDYRLKDEDDWDMDTFFKELQKILPDGEAFIMMGSGYEKLRYVTGWCVVVTNKEIRSTNIQTEALNSARAMLNDSKWNTRMEY